MSDYFRNTVIKKLNNGDFDCTKEFTVSMFSGKHKLLILWILINNGPQGFSYFKKNLKGISKKVLSNQLNELIDDQIIFKQDFFTGKVRHTEYQLTAVGKSLIPIIVALNDWGENRLKQVMLVKKFNSDL
ncbi:helix-turn-helix transcriptional regulator [Weissella paramesenteroides]|jgi:DNA-binding HxlR family transcriptional regulator|uniref:Helix-turn-helix transcriptional regulator n=1 Tax=Weissella paramesenteroides TaxID=1249 RepID=A0ABD4XKE8_WEIPA|nr:helix-turn-helix domain-containing protein [Weissella paramesenteroides]MDF8367442.1 helix-turn-helix transcriptional regulator [Weissella paramesenteroides]MDF8369674.1 helix-turn-helix transcriptional regulator [Weissella paramesenteroides]MDF8371758.1 helix-turn-helix transcriptional regulator [Weissella paramesenteroides]MDF8374440.1 helix-turn-helix transcriptional regulator [Weissella paramesenteroides]WEA52047.1 helix-turn-helix domain-containing protein [Weissella paramesenteroides]